MADIITVANVQGYLDEQNTAWLNAEDVARGFGFTYQKNGIEYVRWERVNEYLESFGYFGTSAENSPRVAKGDYIPENMVYRLGFKANNETAVRFQTILADEVLPSIRKHGVYMTQSVIERTLSDPDYLIQLATTLKDERQKRIAAETRNEELVAVNTEQAKAINEMTPKANYCDIILKSPSTVIVSMIAQDYGMTPQRFNEQLHTLGIQHKVGRQWVLYAKHISEGYVKSETKPMKNSKHGRTYTYTAWTQKGRLFLYETLKGKGILPLIER